MILQHTAPQHFMGIKIINPYQLAMFRLQMGKHILAGRCFERLWPHSDPPKCTFQGANDSGCAKGSESVCIPRLCVPFTTGSYIWFLTSYELRWTSPMTSTDDIANPLFSQSKPDVGWCLMMFDELWCSTPHSLPQKQANKRTDFVAKTCQNNHQRYWSVGSFRPPLAAPLKTLLQSNPPSRFLSPSSL